jgi:hypothetical protein
MNGIEIELDAKTRSETMSASTSAATQALASRFVALLRNYPEPLTDAEVREYFQSEGKGEYEKLPSVINALMGEVRSFTHSRPLWGSWY